MSSIERLTVVSAPFVSLIADPQDVAAEALGWQDSGLVVRAIRGRKARTLDRLFDEFAAALQFPYYFGENWAAFRDCVSDLDWLPFRPGVVVVVHGADEVLADAHPAELTILVQTLATASEEFAEAVNEGEWWDRDPVPFHVVLQGQSDGDFERWRHAGAVPEALV
ncbi:MAG: barstar family protein [Nocardioidaceae bacterium]